MVAPWAYFDTSALIKRYINEPGSAAVRRSLQQHALLSSAITPVEVVSAFLRRRREGDLTKAKFEALLRQVQTDRARWDLVEVSSMVLERAETLIEGFIPIGFLDAVQIASLITFQAVSGICIPFVTADSRQRDSATLRGLDVIWVG
ncbi:MAG: type II toxin-antitoxin system VapC family toxin [Deltaproteobacteria bacterium]|nr:type II toxin-antitoxin system VapC family toxin [Deltaproteobacteria bacterium]